MTEYLKKVKKYLKNDRIKIMIIKEIFFDIKMQKLMKSNFISNLILLILIFTFAGCQQSKIELDSVQYYKDQQYEKAFP